MTNKQILLDVVKINPKTECWVLLLKKYPNRKIPFDFFKYKEHFLSYKEFSWKYLGEGIGIKLPLDAHIVHTCNNKLCVNPEHLYISHFNEDIIEIVSKSLVNVVDIKGVGKLYNMNRKGFSFIYAKQLFDISVPIIKLIIKKRLWEKLK